MAAIASVDKKPPTDIAAFQTSDYSYTFFVRDSDKTLGFLRGPLTVDSDMKQPIFDTYNVSLEGNQVLIAENSRQVAAVAYRYNDKTQIRVYYISRENKRLYEICADEPPKGSKNFVWTKGSLNKSMIKPSETSLLSASVDFSGGGQLKIFYQTEEGGILYVAYVTTGSAAWDQASIMNNW